MPAPKGNEYYLLRSKDGRDTEYDPESFLEIANEYFNWCLENPLIEAQIVKGNRTEEVSLPTKDAEGKSKNVKTKTTIPYDIASLPKMRVFSIQGLCNFAEIALNTFKNYEERKEFLTVTTRVRGIIENQQFEGAASGMLNPNIIARKLGLVEKKEISGEMTVEQVDYSKLSKEALEEIANSDKENNN